jgi:tetratricopeptide (TPR) repeat protein
LPYEVDEDDLLSAIRTICDEPPERLRRARGDTPADLETVLSKALAKEPVRRYRTAGELAADLRRVLAEQPVRARRPTKLYQAAKFVRRHRAVSTSAAAVMLAQSVMVVLLVAQRGQLTEKNETTNAMLITLARALVEAAPIMGFGEDQRASLESVEEALEPQVAGNLADRSLAQSYAEVLYALAGLDQAVPDLVHARARFEHARAVLEELAVDEPGVAARVRLADVYAKLGELARDEGDEGGMDAWFQRAFALHETLVREHPGDGELLEDLAWSLHRTARVALQRGSLEEARALQEHRMRDARALVERDPGNWKFLHNLAQAHMLGGDIVEREDPVAAEAHRREALRLPDELCTQQPRRPDIQAQSLRATLAVARIARRDADLDSPAEHSARAPRQAAIVFTNDPTPADNQRFIL